MKFDDLMKEMKEYANDRITHDVYVTSKPGSIEIHRMCCQCSQGCDRLILAKSINTDTETGHESRCSCEECE